MYSYYFEHRPRLHRRYVGCDWIAKFAIRGITIWFGRWSVFGSVFSNRNVLDWI
jgi:hypothetical protein